MKQSLKLVILLASIAYPFIVYWGLEHQQTGKLLLLLLIIPALRVISGDYASERWISIAILICVILITLIFGHQLGLKFYPALVNFGFLVLFASSLIFPPSIIERLARLREPDLPLSGVAYTLKVTKMWSCFFIINGTIAASTAIWASDDVWALYNGFIAYLIIGMLLAGEWIVRRQFVRN